MRVYLSGPISGLRPNAASTWREEVGQRFRAAGFVVRDPMRSTQYDKRRKIKSDTEYDDPAKSDKAFVQRDLMDVTSCDVILCNLLEAERISVGSIFEIAWGLLLKRPVCVIVMEKNNMHQHPFTRESGIVFDNLDDAVDYVISCAGEGELASEQEENEEAA